MTVQNPDLGGLRGELVKLGAYTPIGAHTETTAVAAAEVLTPKPARATGALIQTVDGNMLFTLDGTDPTVTPGFILFNNQLPIYVPVNDEVTLTIARATIDTSVRYQWVREES